MSDKIKKGDAGEIRAAEFLEQKGFHILEKNFRHGHQEIDLIATSNNWLIFVEVKLRTHVKYGFPEVFVDKTKRRNIRNAARQYIFKKDWKGNVRFDIISITQTGLELDIHHIEDAFY
jgi:putative endonuclease